MSIDVSKDMDTKEDQPLSWSIMIAIAGGLFFFVLTLMLAFVCFRLRLDKNEKIHQGSTIDHKGQLFPRFCAFWSEKISLIFEIQEQIKSIKGI